MSDQYPKYSPGKTHDSGWSQNTAISGSQQYLSSVVGHNTAVTPFTVNKHTPMQYEHPHQSQLQNPTRYKQDDQEYKQFYAVTQPNLFENGPYTDKALAVLN